MNGATNSRRRKRRRSQRQDLPFAFIGEGTCKIFKNMQFYVHPVTVNPARRRVIHNLIRKHGGCYTSKVSISITHILVDKGVSSGRLCRSLGWSKFPPQIKILMVNWVSASVQAKCCLNARRYELSSIRRMRYMETSENAVELIRVDNRNDLEIITISDSTSIDGEADIDYTNLEYLADNGSTFDDGNYEGDTTCDDDWLRVPPNPEYRTFIHFNPQPVSNVNDVASSVIKTDEILPEDKSNVKDQPMTVDEFIIPDITITSDKLITNSVNATSNSLNIKKITISKNNILENIATPKETIISTERSGPDEPFIEKKVAVTEKKLMSKVAAQKEILLDKVTTPEESTMSEEIIKMEQVTIPQENTKEIGDPKKSLIFKKDTVTEETTVSEVSMLVEKASKTEISTVEECVKPINVTESDDIVFLKQLYNPNRIVPALKSLSFDESKSTLSSTLISRLSKLRVIAKSPEQLNSDASNLDLNDTNENSNVQKETFISTSVSIEKEETDNNINKSPEKTISESSSSFIEENSVEECSSSKIVSEKKPIRNPSVLLRDFRITHGRPLIQKRSVKKNTRVPDLIDLTFKTECSNEDLEISELNQSLTKETFQRKINVSSISTTKIPDNCSKTFCQTSENIQESPEIILPISLIKNVSSKSYKSKDYKKISAAAGSPKESYSKKSVIEFSSGEKSAVDSESEIFQVVKMIVESVAEVSHNEKIIKESVAKLSKHELIIEDSKSESFHALNIEKDSAFTASVNEEIDFDSRNQTLNCEATLMDCYEPEVAKFPALNLDEIMSRPSKLTILTDRDPYPLHIFCSPLPKNIYDQTKLPSTECITSAIDYSDVDYNAQRYYSPSSAILNRSQRNYKRKKSINLTKNINYRTKKPRSDIPSTSTAVVSEEDLVDREYMNAESENLPGPCSIPDITQPNLFFDLPSLERDNPSPPPPVVPYRIICFEGPNKHVVLKLQDLYAIFKRTHDRWRVHAYEKAIVSFSKHPHAVESLEEIQCIVGVGNKIAQKIWTLVQVGSLKEIDDFDCNSWVDVRSSFTRAWGITPNFARQLFLEGFTSIPELQSKRRLSRAHLVGLRYYEDLKLRMSKYEAGVILQVVMEIVFQRFPRAQCDACSSVRRNRKSCGHASLLITLHRGKRNNHRMLPEIVAILHEKGYIVDDLIRHEENGLQTNYSGIFKLTEHSILRRLDITVCAREEHVCALLYLTGPAYFNRSIRQWALKREMILDEHSLRIRCLNIDGGTDSVTTFYVPDEATVFRYLALPYRAPEQRDRYKF